MSAWSATYARRRLQIEYVGGPVDLEITSLHGKQPWKDAGGELYVYLFLWFYISFLVMAHQEVEAPCLATSTLC